MAIKGENAVEHLCTEKHTILFVMQKQLLARSWIIASKVLKVLPIQMPLSLLLFLKEIHCFNCIQFN